MCQYRGLLYHCWLLGPAWGRSISWGKCVMNSQLRLLERHNIPFRFIHTAYLHVMVLFFHLSYSGYNGGPWIIYMCLPCAVVYEMEISLTPCRPHIALPIVYLLFSPWHRCQILQLENLHFSCPSCTGTWRMLRARSMRSDIRILSYSFIKVVVMTEE